MVYAQLLMRLEKNHPIEFMGNEIKDIDLTNVMHVLAAVYTMGAGDAYNAILEATQTAVDEAIENSKESGYRNLFGLN